MKRQNCVILMAAILAAMVFAWAVPCRADWWYVGYSVSDNDPNGYYYESGGNYQLEQEYVVSGVDTSAGSGGASASAACEASASVEVMPSGTSVSKSAGAWCETWGEAYFANAPYNPNARLDYDWSVSGSGSVTVSGGVDDSSLGSGDTADSSAFAYGDVGSSEGGGCGYAWGSVSEYSTGTAGYGYGGYASEDYADTDVHAGYYYATLSFSVEGSDSGYTYDSQFTAGASVGASASCDASVSASQGYSGSADAGASASCSGDASISVSY